MESAMSKESDAATANEGVTAETNGDERTAQSGAPAGNAVGRGEKLSPSNRQRGEASSADGGAPVDLDAAHDRAS
jgi:hypothetical protein